MGSPVRCSLKMGCGWGGEWGFASRAALRGYVSVMASWVRSKGRREKARVENRQSMRVSGDSFIGSVGGTCNDK